MENIKSKIGHLILDNLPNNLLLVDQSGIIVYANQQVEKTFGYSAEEIIGKSAQMLIPDYQRNSVSTERAEYYQNPQPLPIGYGVEVIGLKKSGEEFPMEIGLSPLKTDEGIIISVSILDNTRRKRIEEDLLKKNELLNLAEEITQIGHWQWNVIPNIITWSDNLYSLFHREKGGKLSYETYFGYVYEDDREFVTNRVEEIFKDKEFHHFFHRIRTGNGQIKTIQLKGKVLINEKGEVAEMVGTCQDVTKQKADEKKLKVFNDQLKAKNKELEMFAYVAGHDLKEPVRTISAMTQLFMESHGSFLDKEGLELIDIMSNSAQRMKRLISDLSDYSKLGVDRSQSTEDCNHILEEVMKDLSLAIEEADAEITIDRLPVVQCYRTEIRLLFQNLISNAIKFRKPNSKPIIQISASLRDEYWEFTVADNGIGMPKDSLSEIFQIFRRLHGRIEYEGTGIGLAHCKKIVELHGGQIWVESEHLEGSTFYFTIPLN